MLGSHRFRQSMLLSQLDDAKVLKLKISAPVILLRYAKHSFHSNCVLLQN